MDLAQARDILELPCQFSDQDLRKQYRKLSLRYHPDKNKSPDATEKFLCVQKSYEYLSVNLERIPDEKINNYDDLLKEFLNSISGNSDLNIIIYMTKILNNINNISTIKDISPSIIITCYSLLNKHKDTFNISDQTLKMIEKIINGIVSEDSNHIHIVKPTIEDLIQHNICKLNVNDDIYYIPSWHSEVVFESKTETKHEITIKCIPQLPDFITIDVDNNIHCYVKTPISSLLTKDNLDVNIVNNLYKIQVNKLRITKHQLWKFHGFRLLVWPSGAVGWSRGSKSVASG